MPNTANNNNTRAVHFLGLAVFLFVASWLTADHYPPWNGFYNEITAFLGLWALLLYGLLTFEHTKLDIPYGAACLFAVALIPVAQAASGLIFFQGDAWMAAIYVTGFGLACAMGYILATDKVEAAAGLMALAFLFGALLSAAISVYQWLDLQGLEPWVYYCGRWSRVCGNLGQPNHVATLLSLGLAALIYLRSRREFPSVIALLLAVLLIFGIVLTQSRVPWVATILLSLWWFAKRRSVPRIKGSAIGLGLVFYASLVVFWPHGTETALTPATSQRADLTQAGTHFQNWTEMLRATGNEPWFGYGWNQVAVAHVQTAHERHTYAEMLTHSHNFFLDLIIWNGLPIGVLLIGGILWWLTTRTWRCRTPESWFALLAIGIVGAHAMFEYPLDYAYFLLPVGLLVGLVESDQSTGPVFTVPKITLWPVLAAFTFFMGWIWHEYRIVEADYRLMRFETRNIGPVKADQPAPNIVLLTHLREDLRMARSLARPGMSAEELEWMRRITYRYPWYSSLFRYAVSLALNGREQEGSVEFRRLYDIYGAKPYEEAKAAVQILADTRYPALKDWKLPPP